MRTSDQIEDTRRRVTVSEDRRQIIMVTETAQDIDKGLAVEGPRERPLHLRQWHQDGAGLGAAVGGSGRSAAAQAALLEQIIRHAIKGQWPLAHWSIVGCPGALVVSESATSPSFWSWEPWSRERAHNIRCRMIQFA